MKATKMLALVMALIMMLNLFSFGASATTEEIFGNTNVENVEENANPLAWIPTINKTATELDEFDQTNVTLSVPGEAQDYTSDIVFIIGNGPANNYTYIVEMIRKMLIAADGTATKIKIGMVGFADTTEDETVLELTEMNDVVEGNNVADYRIEGRYNNGSAYTESAEDYAARKAAAFAAWETENPLLLQDMEYIIAKALERAEDVYSGINLESALITARDMLAADEEVPADRKHMIVISTGLTYWFDNDAGEPVTIVGTNKFGNIMHGNKYWLKARDNSTNTSAGYYLKGWMVVNGADGKPDYKASWNRYWEMIEGWIAADQDDYVYNPGKTYSEFYYNGNSTEIRPENNANYRYGSAIQNAEDLAKVTGAVPYFDGGANPETNANAAHALNYERAQYESWVVYKQMETPIGESFETALGDTVEGLGFNCYAIAIGKTAEPGNESTWLETDQIGYNFMHMLGGENTVNYNDGDLSFFKPIENKILYYCSNGSRVEDYIGFEAGKGNFEFIQNPEFVTLTVGTTVYTTAQVETKEGYDFSLAFTAPNASEPTFWLDYTYGNGQTSEMFVWTFGENISRYNPASLTYKLQLTEKNDEFGFHVVDTNISATLYPVDSEGNEREPEVFPVPNVRYCEPIEVVIEGAKFMDNAPATGYEFALMQGEDVLQTVPATEGAFAFDALRFSKAGTYTYQVVEVFGEDETVVYDPAVYTVEIVVTDNEVALVYEISFVKDNETVSEIAFFNKTVAGTEVTLNGNKYLDGQLADGFQFTLTGENVEQTVSTIDGVFTFDTLYFGNAGIYTYEIREVAGEDEGIVYDESVYTVTITVVKNVDHLEAAVEIKLADEIVDEIAFNNKTVAGTEVTLSGNKYLDGQLADGFQFTLTGEGMELTADSINGVFTFDTLYFSNAGIYTYEIREAAGDDDYVIYDEAAYTVTITVIKDGDKLVATVETKLADEIVDEIAFNNKTVAGTEVTLSGNKYLDGQLADGFQFTLTGEGMELTADSINGVFTFDTLYFSNAGIYTYEIREAAGDDDYVIYDEAAYTMTITVIKDGDKLVATVETKLADELVDEIAFNNKTVAGTSVTLSGNKYLDGDLADGFQFTLLGETVEQTVGSTDGVFTFDTLHFDKVGTYTFLIYEEAGEDEEINYDESEYFVTITVIKNGDQLEAAVEIVLNDEIVPVVEFYNETEEELTPPVIPELPTPDEDGDPIFGMMLVMLVSVALMGGCVVLKRKEA